MKARTFKGRIDPDRRIKPAEPVELPPAGTDVLVTVETTEEGPVGEEGAMEQPDAFGQPPTPEELARRKVLVARILAKRKERVIAPVTSAELVRRARKEEMGGYDPGD